MVEEADMYDPWQMSTAASSSNDHEDDIFRAETIENVIPLDRQIGIVEKKTAPPVLQHVLFGQPESIERADDSRELDPPMLTYAVLDANKVANLRDMLETSGLEHRCLFTGNAYDELKDGAPWIVRLEEGNRFTRNLFTRSDTPWHLWDSEPGIYIRSRATLDDLWRHLRKFTRIQDEAGNWFYQRFWEPHALMVYAESETSPFAGADIHNVIALQGGEARIVFPGSTQTKFSKPVLTVRDRQLHARNGTRIYALDLARKFFAAAPEQMRRLGLSSSGPMTTSIIYMGNALARFEITRSADVARICACGLFHGMHILRDPRNIQLVNSTLGQGKIAPSVRALHFEQGLRSSLRHAPLISDAGLKRACDDLAALESYGILPTVPYDHAGIPSSKVQMSFWAACNMGWHQAGFSPDESSLRKTAHMRLSLLWTPYFLQDPIHIGLKELFLQSRKNEITTLIHELRQRLNEG